MCVVYEKKHPPQWPQVFFFFFKHKVKKQHCTLISFIGKEKSLLKSWSSVLQIPTFSTLSQRVAHLEGLEDGH